MDFYNHNANRKRKLTESKEQEGYSKRKKIPNEQTVGCFGRCCSRKKHQIVRESIQNSSRIETDRNEKLKTSLPSQSVPIEKAPNVLKKSQLSRSPFHIESRFCQPQVQSFNDPCTKCTVHYGPDIWENIPKEIHNSAEVNRVLTNASSMVTVDRSDVIQRMIKDDTFDTPSKKEDRIDKTRKTWKNNVDAYISSVIDDGIDRASKISSDRPEEKDAKALFNSQNDQAKQKLVDLTEHQQTYSGLLFEKQNLKVTSHHSAIELSFDNTSSDETKSTQSAMLNKENSSVDPEPYNWDDQERSSMNRSATDHLTDKFLHDQLKETTINSNEAVGSDNDVTHRSYSVTSVAPPNMRKTDSNQSRTLNSSLDSFIQRHDSFTHSFKDRAEDQRKTNEDERRRIYLNEHQEMRSNLSSTENSMRFPAFDDNELQTKHSSSRNEQQLSFDDNRSLTSSKTLHQQQIPKHTKKDKSNDVDSISTEYSTPVSVRPSIFPEKAPDTLAQSSRPPDVNVFAKRTRSDTSDKHRHSREVSHPVNQKSSLYHDITNLWRQLFDGFLNALVPSIRHTDHTIHQSSSTPTLRTPSWSTITPDTTQYDDNISPWWGRRDELDRTPATFLFVNDGLSNWCSIETATTDKRFTNRLYFCTCYHCPAVCSCCCNSSISINNCL